MQVNAVLLTLGHESDPTRRLGNTCDPGNGRTDVGDRGRRGELIEESDAEVVVSGSASAASGSPGPVPVGQQRRSPVGLGLDAVPWSEASTPTAPFTLPR